MSHRSARKCQPAGNEARRRSGWSRPAEMRAARAGCGRNEGTKASSARSTGAERGLTLVELMVAMALTMTVMSVAVGAVIESERSLNTVQARNADANAAQSWLARMETQVRAAAAVSVECISAGSPLSCGSAPPVWQSPTATELWIYNPDASWACTAWEMTNSSLQLSAGTDHSHMSAASVVLLGITAGSFTYLGSNFAGLVDVNLEVLNAGSAGASDLQQYSAPSQIELQMDDPNMSTGVGTGYPSVAGVGSC